jgi:type II secretory pathway component GspD/PulD (secretin)
VVTLPSDSTLIIGGLTFNRDVEAVEKVPFLGDLPIIGEAFRQTEQQSTQTTVFVFIRPVIVRDEAMTDLRLLTEGPRKALGLPGDTPELEPERIPIRSGSLGSSGARPDRPRREVNDPS